MPSRMDAGAMHRLLSDLHQVERLLAGRYRRLRDVVHEEELDQRLEAAAQEADQRGDALELLLADLRLSEPSPSRRAEALFVARLDDGPMGRFAGFQDLLAAEEFRRNVVRCLRTAADTLDNGGLRGAADFLDERSVTRIAWLEGLTACFAVGALAPQTNGGAERPHRQDQPSARAVPPGHRKEFTSGPNAAPV